MTDRDEEGPTAMPELLAPAGDMRCLTTALDFGADAVYIGGPGLQLRAAKTGFDREGVREAARLCHTRGKRLYVATNAFLSEGDLPAARDLARFLGGCGADAAIVSDLGMLSLVREEAPGLEIHVSTQANCLNSRAAALWARLGARRVILGREATLDEIRAIRAALPDRVQIEVFIHGAMCMAYSGRCLLSAYLAGRSANRGGCTQPCRWRYALVEETRPGMRLPIKEDGRGTAILSSQDLCAAPFLDELAAAGAASLKIEGRMKGEYYVATAVNAYRALLDGRMTADEAMAELNCFSHRPYSSGFYFSDLRYGHDGREEYLADCVYAGYVTVCAGGRVSFEQHGVFSAGDELEVLSPFAPVRRFRAEALEGPDGLSCQTANRSGHPYSMACPFPLRPGDILRRREKAER